MFVLGYYCFLGRGWRRESWWQVLLMKNIAYFNLAIFRTNFGQGKNLC